MHRKAIDQYDGPATLGIDVSHWQTGDIDFGLVASAGVRFVYVRTGDGKDTDRYAVQNLRAAKAAGLLVSVYHYLRTARRGARQAELMERIVDHSGVCLDLPPAIDLEGAPAKGKRPGSGAFLALTDRGEITIEETLEETRIALESAEYRFGMRPILYTATTWHWYVSQPGKVPQWAECYPLWLPSYSRTAKLPVDRNGNPAPWDHWRIWQYTSKGEIAGVPTPVDLNRWRGAV